MEDICVCPEVLEESLAETKRRCEVRASHGSGLVAGVGLSYAGGRCF